MHIMENNVNKFQELCAQNELTSFFDYLLLWRLKLTDYVVKIESPGSIKRH